MGRSGGLRLTRRGRMVVVLLLSGIMATLVGLISTASEAAGPASAAPVAVVRPGDTLWNIATREFPELDPYRVIDAIRQLNGIADYTVHPGEHLRLPTLR